VRSMQNLNVAPVAGLFAVLVVIGVMGSQDPMGHAVQIAVPGAPDACGDGRTIVAHVLDDSHVKLNAETVDLPKLAARLRGIYKARAERVLFLKAAPELPFQKVAEVIDIAKKQIEVVAIVTPSVEEQPCWLVRPPTPIEWISTERRAPRP